VAEKSKLSVCATRDAGMEMFLEIPGSMDLGLGMGERLLEEVRN